MVIRFTVDSGAIQTSCDVCADWRYLDNLRKDGRAVLYEAADIMQERSDVCDFCGLTGAQEQQERYRKGHKAPKSVV